MNKTIPSDAKVLLDDWETLSRILLQVGTPLKNRNTAEKNSSRLIADSVIQDAVTGPYHPFFASKLKAFAKICELRMLITISENEAFQPKKKKIVKETENQKLAKKMSIAGLDKKQKALDELTNEHFSQWQNVLKKWIQNITQALTHENIPLSELEAKTLSELEPVSELLDRFKDLNIAPPKNKKGEFNFSTYLKYKTDLAIHSSLSRRHQPHEKKEIDTVIKKLKSVFSDIEKEEAKLASQQENETDILVEFKN